RQLAQEALALGALRDLLGDRGVELRLVRRVLRRLARDHGRDRADVAREHLAGVLRRLRGERFRRAGRAQSPRDAAGGPATGGGGGQLLAARGEKAAPLVLGLEVTREQLVELLAARGVGGRVAHQDARHRTDERQELALDLGELLARPGDERARRRRG